MPVSDQEFETFLDDVRAEIRKIGAESAGKLMNQAAFYGSAIRLMKHFGSADATQKAGLTAQLHFLLHESVDKAGDRLRMAAVWADANKASTKASPELDALIEELKAATLGQMSNMPSELF